MNTKFKEVNWLKQIYDAIKSLSLSTSQNDWAETNPESPAYIKNKPNVPVRYEVDDITAIDGEVLSALKCGDQVVKRTAAMLHLYVVSYKGAGVGQGICLTYVDASRVETVSYDFTEDGWVYNSTDVTPLVQGEG